VTAALARRFATLPPRAGDGLPLRDVLLAQRAMLVADGADAAAAETVLAREHYFPSWDAALAEARLVDGRFEAAANAIVEGDLGTLARLLAEAPELATARSAYGHRQTLLQHVSANGIEMYRQWQSPANAPELARALLAAGAEPDATCEPYGHPDTALTLLVSSCHPAEAGVQAELVDVLVRGGARVDGIDDDGAPLWTAIVWGYQLAVDRLVACGARVDNLVFAAASGDVDRVRPFLDGSVNNGASAARIGRYGAVLEPERLLEYALIYAASLDRREVVELLVQRGPDLTVVEPVYRATAMDVAQHGHAAAGRPHGNPEIVVLLATSGQRRQ
jgi:hypothetical protein